MFEITMNLSGWIKLPNPTTPNFYGYRGYDVRPEEQIVRFENDTAYNKVLDTLKKPVLSGKMNYIKDMTNAEKAQITSEFNTNLTKAERTKKFVARAVGNYYYKARNNGFNDYKFIGRYLLDDLYD